MERSNIESLYIKRGLITYRLSCLDDLRVIHKVDVTELKGYSNLTSTRQEIFNKFLINFYNANGLGKRMGLVPKSIHYVEKTTYTVSRPADDNHDEPYQEVVCDEYKILLPNGKKKMFKKNVYYKEVDPSYWLAFSKEEFIRFDYKTDKRSEWLHVISETQWY